MPLLTRKRKRKTNDDNHSNSNSTVTSMANNSEVEDIRTDETSNLSVDNVLIDISLNQNFNKSQSQRINSVSQTIPQLLEEEPMNTQIDGEFEEQLSNRWADDVSQTEDLTTQLERNIKDQVSEETERAKQNVAECGTLESITLINFMCHNHFHLDFGPRINFIVGRNGSMSSFIFIYHYIYCLF